MNSEIPQSEEFAKENQFRVKLDQPEEIIRRVQETGRVRKAQELVNYQGEDSAPFGFQISTLKQGNGLFSNITVYLHDVFDHPTGWFFLIRAGFKEIKHQYVSQQEKHLLSNLMITSGYRNVEVKHGENSQDYSLDMDDPDSEFKYRLELRWENERSKWVDKVRHYHKSLKIFGGIPPEQIVGSNISSDEFDQIAESTDISSINPALTFRAFPTDQEKSKNPYLGNFQLSETEMQRTVQKLEKVSRFLEDTINAMSRVKGIPQSGKLTLLPPSEIPQT